MISSSQTKTFDLEYSDRFSPIDEISSNRERTKMSVTLKKNKLRGDGDALWVVSFVKGKKDGDRL